VSTEGQAIKRRMRSKEGNDACASRIGQRIQRERRWGQREPIIAKVKQEQDQKGMDDLIIKKESLHNNGKHKASSTKVNIILLDNGFTLSLFGNPDMVTNIRESKTTLELATNSGTKELATNAGTQTTKQVPEEPRFGMVWYDKTAIANVFGFFDLKKKHSVTFD
jgi:hypothetical protein